MSIGEVMSIRSTIILIMLATIPVAAAFLGASVPPPPAPPSGPVSWQAAKLNGDTSLVAGSRILDLVLLPDGRGFAAGNQSQFWITEDGAKSWRSIAGPATAPNLVGVAVNGPVLLTSIANGRIFRSTDRGQSWVMVRPPGTQMRRIAFATSDTVFAVGDRDVLRSSDAGQSWKNVDSVPAADWSGVGFASSALGYVVGGIGRVLITRDGGATWEHVALPTDALLRGLAVLDDSSAVIVGTGGTIFRTTDSGRTWPPIASGTQSHLLDVAFADAHRGVAVGMYGMTLATLDGGVTWSRENAGTNAHLLAVEFSSNGSVAAAGLLGVTVFKAARSVEVAR